MFFTNFSGPFNIDVPGKQFSDGTYASGWVSP